MGNAALIQMGITLVKTILGSIESDTLFGSNGDDVIYSLGSSDVIKTAGGKDVISAFGNIITGNGNDKLFNIFSSSELDSAFDKIYGALSQSQTELGSGNDLYVSMFHNEFEPDITSASDLVDLGSGNDTSILGEGFNNVTLGRGNDKVYVSSESNISATEWTNLAHTKIRDDRDTIYIDAQFMKNSYVGYAPERIPYVDIYGLGAKDKVVLYNTDLNLNQVKIRTDHTGTETLTVSLDGGIIHLGFDSRVGSVPELTAKNFTTTSKKITHTLEGVDGVDQSLSKMYIGSDGSDKATLRSHVVAHMQGGNDVVKGTARQETVYGENGHDTLDGKEGDDVLSGGRGNDLIFGSGGDDVIRAGSGDDSLEGGIGDDILYSGPGKDTLSGGEGDDSFFVLTTGGTATIDTGLGNDNISVTGDELVHVILLGFDPDSDVLQILPDKEGEKPFYANEQYFEQALTQFEDGVYLDTFYGNPSPPGRDVLGIFFTGLTIADVQRADILF